MSTFNYNWIFDADDNGVLATINKINDNVEMVDHSINGWKDSFKKVAGSINKSLKTIELDSMLNNVERTTDGIRSLNEPGMELSTSMSELSAITGVTGEKLDELEDKARKNAVTFGNDAADGAETFKLVLSQLSPEIAKVPDALDSMGHSVSTTSKLMSGDTTAATEVLTTAMNQYQVSLDDPIQASEEMADMMNIMAAAANEGSAELPQIQAALEQSGMAAKSANVSFAETNAAIQILDKSGKKGSEGGVALRNTLATLSQGRFLPKDIQQELAAAGIQINDLTDNSKTLAQRLTPLKGIMHDQALITKLFGKENSNAAIALISQITEMDRLTTAVTGTNSAYEQADVIMDSPMEKNARLTSQINDFKISLFNATDGLLGYASVIGDTAFDISNLIPLISGMGSVISFVTSQQKLMALWTGIISTGTKVWTGAQWLLNTAFWANPITWIVAGIIALIAAIAWVVTSTEGWGEAWDHTVNAAKLIFKAFIEGVKANFNTVVNGIMIGINAIKVGWYKFKDAVGLGDSTENQNMIAQINQDTEDRKQAIIDGHKKVAGLVMEAYTEQVLAVNSIKLKEDDPESEGIAGISAPSIPGMTDSTENTNNDGATTAGKKTNTAIATGGTKHQYITIKMQNLVGEIIPMMRDATDTQKVTDQTIDALLRVMAMATTAGN
ncbi:phage tail tape measure protein [Aquimarina algiphila]|uniref:phage tail tape measure protein n=1 Tax=Aquimarina algiphila TaxID=2047982 RepID=UPI00232DC850|nr:phage tail tape measure protein [Aquimarina algiphila]